MYKKADGGVSMVLVVPELEDIWSLVAKKLGMSAISELLEISLPQL